MNGRKVVDTMRQVDVFLRELKNRNRQEEWKLTREASFDYCFNYFQSFRFDPRGLAHSDYLQHSCLQLGFYLSSCGRYSGGSALLQTSAKLFQPLIGAVAESKIFKECWDIDVSEYGQGKNVQILLGCGSEIRRLLRKGAAGITGISEGWSPGDALVTKIMLGIFGNVPAFDNYFGAGFHEFNNAYPPAPKLCSENLEIVYEAYNQFRYVIDRHQPYIKTWDFNGEKTERSYTKARLIDMYFREMGVKVRHAQ